MNAASLNPTVCYHCGDHIIAKKVEFENKLFCCDGCKLVFQVISSNDLCKYYDITDSPGVKDPSNVIRSALSFLDEPEIADKFYNFKSADLIAFSFFIPNMHCASCIWLLENLNKLDAGVLISEVHFIKKKVSINFDPHVTSLRKIAELLSFIGYHPDLSLGSTKTIEKEKNYSRIYKIGVAGFCFGNIMLLSFPEYFSNQEIIDSTLAKLFTVLNLALAIPVFFYSASEFFLNAFNSFKQKVINMDVPISIGILAMFLRSIWEISTGSGPGYLDSMTGLIFFMLIGRFFQDRTFKWLSFERDYSSYFPISVEKYGESESIKSIPVENVAINDVLNIKNQEIIPVDVLLISDFANIDYSFITGESFPVEVKRGEKIFAGGKQIGTNIKVVAQSIVSKSYLTSLWNKQKAQKNISKYQQMVHKISSNFIIITLLISLVSFVFWYLNNDFNRAINAMTSVLVIACACALALSAPFTFGNILQILGKSKMYLKGNEVIEDIADINHIVFDKTGTITEVNQTEVAFVGELSPLELRLVVNVANNSNHPYSKSIVSNFSNLIANIEVNDLKEIFGNGIQGNIHGKTIKIGKHDFVVKEPSGLLPTNATFVSIDNELKGYFLFHNKFRNGIEKLFKRLNDKKIAISVLSGDNDTELGSLNEMLMGANSKILFFQKPEDKRSYIQKLREKGESVMMVGDGLNDAGALLESNVGIAVSEDVNNFVPSCDGIIDAKALIKIDKVITYSKSGINIIIASFILSLVYNVIGIGFAVTGNLSPVIAAILMPISTISLVLFTVFLSTIAGRKIK